MKHNNPKNHPYLKGFKAKSGTLEEKLDYMRKMKEVPENREKMANVYQAKMHALHKKMK